MDKPLCQSVVAPTAEPTPNSIQTLADQGDAGAQFALGVSYSAVEGDPQRLELAVEWYRKAAHQNHRLAQFNLGMMFAMGQGVPRDDAAASQWLRRAAEGGDAGAQFQLGNRCHRGSFSQMVSEAAELRIEAFKWFQLAATQGYGNATDCRDRVTVRMSGQEVTEGYERAARFLAARADSPGEVQAPKLSP